jgi:epoxyqueuosine reductase
MPEVNIYQGDLAHNLLLKAKGLGASLAGIAPVVSLQNAPSYEAYGEVEWSEEAKSVLVLALVHEASEPELDWWDDRKGGTPGNRLLINMANELAQWLSEEFDVKVKPLPYKVEKGGIFLKDAAVLAGLGIIGKNNLLITPEYGPRVRLRGLLIDLDLTPTGPIDYSPCETCDMLCRAACPQNALEEDTYSRTSCSKQMKEDIANKEIFEKSQNVDSISMCIRYCRACELACPVAR